QAARAAGRAQDLTPVIAAIRAAGTTSLGGIARALNARGIPAPRGGAWSDVQVRRTLLQA
ncbi:recombinase family protein, partial [Methylobacterium aerolatum]